MSKAHRPPHRNPRTGQWLRNLEQVCPACWENFTSTEAGDAHRVGEFGVDRRCANPIEVGLTETVNKYGTKVWRLIRKNGKEDLEKDASRLAPPKNS